MDKKDYPKQQEYPEDTKTEHTAKRIIPLMTTEEGNEILDSDELLLLVEASDIIDSNLASEEVITDGDEFLGDDELQLLEEACAYEQCWFSDVDEYDRSDCDRSGKSEALVHYKDIVADQHIGWVMDVGTNSAGNSPSEMKVNVADNSAMHAFDYASDQLDASIYEQLPSSPQIPFIDSLPLSKERHHNTAFAPESTLPTPLAPKRDFSNASQIFYDREVYSVPTFPAPSPTSLSENVPELNHFDIPLESKPSNKVNQNMEVIGGMNNGHLRRPEFSPFLYGLPPPISGKQSRSSDISMPAAISYRPYPPPPPAFYTRNRYDPPIGGFLSSTLQETKVYLTKTNEIYPNDQGNERSRSYEYCDLPTTSNHQYVSTRALLPISDVLENELRTGHTRKNFLPPPPPSNILPKEEPQNSSFRPPPPPTFP